MRQARQDQTGQEVQGMTYWCTCKQRWRRPVHTQHSCAAMCHPTSSLSLTSAQLPPHTPVRPVRQAGSCSPPRPVAQLTCSTISTPLTAPTSEGSPYMPVMTYTMAWPIVISSPSTCSAVFLQVLTISAGAKRAEVWRKRRQVLGRPQLHIHRTHLPGALKTGSSNTLRVRGMLQLTADAAASAARLKVAECP